MVLRTSQVKPRRAPRPGLTLLEVLVSMAILILSLVALSRLIELGSNLAVEANAQTECLRLAESKLNEATADTTVLTSSASGDVAENPNYKWELTSTPDPDLANVYNV